VQVLDFKATGADDVMPERLPEGRFLPEGEAHAGLRARIAELASPSSSSGGNVREVKVKEQDVFLYPTGMAAIYRLHRALMEARGGGKVVILGSIFHNTYHLFHESEDGCEHFGRCDGQSRVVERLALWLEGEKQAGRRVAYVFLEFPSNPILVSVDLKGLREVVSCALLFVDLALSWNLMLTMIFRPTSTTFLS
jgi:cystathionine beta-lyase/cystathionine gamma-synthase